VAALEAFLQLKNEVPKINAAVKNNKYFFMSLLFLNE
jgi:hypothetical protein